MDSDVGEMPEGLSAGDIEAALSKTGFLLEHRVAQSLRRHRNKPYVTVADAYPDPESGKSREIDVYASFDRWVEREPAIRIQIAASLIIECKSSSGPFVLIGDHGQESPSNYGSMCLTFDPFTLKFPKALDQSVTGKLRLLDLPGLPTRGDFTGYQLLHLNRQGNIWKADNNAIYDSILYPLAKAGRHKLGQLESEVEEGIWTWKDPAIE